MQSTVKDAFNTALWQSAAMENIGSKSATAHSKTLNKTITHAINNGTDYNLMTKRSAKCLRTDHLSRQLPLKNKRY